MAGRPPACCGIWDFSTLWPPARTLTEPEWAVFALSAMQREAWLAVPGDLRAHTTQRRRPWGWGGRAGRAGWGGHSNCVSCTPRVRAQWFVGNRGCALFKCALGVDAARLLQTGRLYVYGVASVADACVVLASALGDAYAARYEITGALSALGTATATLRGLPLSATDAEALLVAAHAAAACTVHRWRPRRERRLRRWAQHPPWSTTRPKGTGLYLPGRQIVSRRVPGMSRGGVSACLRCFLARDARRADQEGEHSFLLSCVL